MADDKEKKIKITIDADEATKQLQEIKEALAATQKELADLQEKSKKTEKSMSSFGSGIKKVGQIMTGFIGGSLFIKLFEKIGELFMNNEKITKTLNIAFNFLQIVVNKIVDAVSGAISKVSEMTDGFKSTKEVVSGLVDGALNLLILSINSIIFGIKELQLGWKKLFNKSDTEGIKKLSEEIDGLKLNIKDAAKKIGTDAKKIATNATGMLSEAAQATTAIVKSTTSALSTINIKATADLAKYAADAKEKYGKIAIDAQGEIDSLESISEKHRQVRDDAKNSFEVRKKASEELVKSNKEQYEAALKLADAHVKLAEADLALNNNADTRLALATAQQEKNKAESDYEGKRSEQLQSNNGLIAEEQANIIALDQANFDLQNTEKQAQIDREKNFEKNIQMQKNLAKETRDRNLEVFKAQSENMNLTQAERDMALKNMEKAQSDYNIVIQKLDDQSTQHQIDNQKEILNNVISSNNASYDAKKKAIEDLAKLELENTALTEEQKKQIKIKSNNDIKALEDERKQKIIDTAQSSVNMVRSIDEQYTQFKQNLLQNQLKNGEITQAQFDKKSAELEKKAAQRKKAYAIGDAIISTAQSIIGFLAKPGGIPGIALSVAAGILGAAQIATIASTPVDGGTSASAPSTSSISDKGSGTAPTTSFSFAEAPKTPETQPARTYVVSKEVTTQQELDRQIISNGTI